MSCEWKLRGRSEYLQRRRTVLLDLAAEAACQAVQMWGGEWRAISHLLWGTMTGGMDSPSMDILLSKKLGLRADVQRISVEGMGCLTGFRLVNMARQLVLVDPNAKVLIVEGELRSLLGNSLPEHTTRPDIVSACLFRDAASAAVVAGDPNHGYFQIVDGRSMIVPETQHLAAYQEQESGAVRLHLDRSLPAAVGQAEPEFLASLLSNALPGEAISMADVDIACHTGGPKILQEVAQAAGVSEDQMQASWAVMKTHGNLSGASNLAVLNHHLRYVNTSRSWVIGLAMGPGICLEGVLFKRMAQQQGPLFET